MKPIFFPLIIGSALLFSGCQTTQVAENAADINVSFKFDSQHACPDRDAFVKGLKAGKDTNSKKSPEIRLANVPAGTKHLKVRMVDLDYTKHNHGNETIPYSSDTIAEGALRTYDGPCPPKKHRYRISITALNEAKDLILGSGESIDTWPK